MYGFIDRVIPLFFIKIMFSEPIRILVLSCCLTTELTRIHIQDGQLGAAAVVFIMAAPSRHYFCPHLTQHSHCSTGLQEARR